MATRSEFVTLEDHNETLLEGINSTVSRNDRLVFLGDFCREKPGRWRQRIRCRNIFFILGNHDKETKVRKVFGNNVWYQKTLNIGALPIWCCHFPTAFWDKSHYGALHCYGHIHYNPVYEILLDEAFPGRRSMNVCVDMAKKILGEWRPFSEDEVLDHLATRPGHDHTFASPVV